MWRSSPRSLPKLAYPAPGSATPPCPWICHTFLFLSLLPDTYSLFFQSLFPVSSRDPARISPRLQIYFQVYFYGYFQRYSHILFQGHQIMSLYPLNCRHALPSPYCGWIFFCLMALEGINQWCCSAPLLLHIFIDHVCVCVMLVHACLGLLVPLAFPQRLLICTCSGRVITHFSFTLGGPAHT